MQDNDLVNRLVALPNLIEVPKQELEWIVAHGELEIHEAGTIIASKGKRIDKLWIVLSGCVAVQVDRGLGPKLVIEWRTGEVVGMLPYSRMTGPPGNNYLNEKSELLAIHVKNFPKMINQCPKFTTYTVHTMLDRARRFNTSDLQDEKMISLGKLSAGLAHEINNPAATMVRGSKQLLVNLSELDTASRKLGAAGINEDMFTSVGRLRSECLLPPTDNLLSPIQKSEREEEMTEWLAHHKIDTTHAEHFASTPVTIYMLDSLAKKLSSETLSLALHWIATYCSTHLLALDIEQSASRISELVSAVKRFTYMDTLAGSEALVVENGLRDTIKMLAAKTKSKSANITLDVQANVPRVRAIGSELNQVWMNLIDNALDAISNAGNIHIDVQRDLERVVVRIVDDGSGIPEEILPRIFDPFVTTKPPGQGTGLGLDISRQLLRLHRGDITVQSRPGKTEFRVSLIADKTKFTKENQTSVTNDQV